MAEGTSKINMEVGTQTEPKMKPELDDETLNKMWAEAEFGLLERVAQKRPKLAWEVILEYLLKIYKEDIMSQRSEKPYHVHLSFDRE